MVPGYHRCSQCRCPEALDERLASRSTEAHVPEPESAVPMCVSGDMELSKKFCREAVLTFTEDPFHESSLAPIPECNSWYELADASDATQDHADQPEPLGSPARQTCRAHGRSRSPRSAGNFLSATISSELKRSTSSVNRLGGNASRMSGLDLLIGQPGPFLSAALVSHLLLGLAPLLRPRRTARGASEELN